jgi:hypothetical protein
MYSKRTSWPVFSVFAFALVVISSSADAQNLPPPGAYQPIPNFTGVGAGLQFREAINSRLSGGQPILPMVVSPTFANLPAEQDGVILYCKDCKRTTPCGSGGGGAIAIGARGQWSCTISALESALNANGNKVTSLANGTASGDALSFGQASGGDLGGSLPNPTVATVLGGQVPVTTSTAITGGDLSGTLPAAVVQTVLGGKAPIYSGQTGAQVNTMAGAKHDGSDALSGFNVNGVYNVKAYGAKGDAATDDTASIQNVLNAECTTPGSGFLPSATGYRINYPLWGKCNGANLSGTGIAGPIEPFYDFGKTLLFMGSAYTGIPLRASLVSGAGNAFDFTPSSRNNTWLNLREWDGINGPLGSPSGMNLNGLSALTVEMYVEDVTTGDGNMVTSNSVPSQTIGQVAAFQTRISGGQWGFQLHTTGGNVGNNGGAVTTGNTYYYALTYDGTTARMYVCIPGSTNCSPAATAAASGTIVQDPTEDVTIGPSMGSSWPNGGSYAGAINGYVDSVRISNSARWTGTIGTVPSAKFSADSNTLILTNGETAPGGAPFIKAYDNSLASGSWGFGWLFEYFSGSTVPGLNQTYNTVQNIVINPNGPDVSGLMFDGTHNATADHISCGEGFGFKGCEIGFELWNLAYNNFIFSNLYDLGVPGRYGIVASNANDVYFYNTQVTNAWACEAINSNATLTDPLCTQSSITVPRYGLAVSAGIGGSITEINPQDDAEGSGAFSHLFVTGPEFVSIQGGAIAGSNNASAAVLDNGARVTFTGVNMYADHSPTQIIAESGALSPVAVTNATLQSWGSAPWSSTLGAVTATPCNGLVTLSSGSGTFTNICVRANSICGASAAHAVTIGTPAAGSVALTGTGTDVVSINCQ